MRTPDSVLSFGAFSGNTPDLKNTMPFYSDFVALCQLERRLFHFYCSSFQRSLSMKMLLLKCMMSLRYEIVFIEDCCLMRLSLNMSSISRHLCLFIAENMLQLLCETWVMICYFNQTRSSLVYICTDVLLFLFPLQQQHPPHSTNTKPAYAVSYVTLAKAMT